MTVLPFLIVLQYVRKKIDSLRQSAGIAWALMYSMIAGNSAEGQYAVKGLLCSTSSYPDPQVCGLLNFHLC